MKKYLSGLFTGIIIMFTVTSFASGTIKNAYFNQNIKVNLDEKQLDTELVTVELEGQPYGTNYISTRTLAESLGATVSYDYATQTINIATNEPDKTIIETESEVNTMPKDTENKPTRTTYKGYEAIEQDGITYVQPSYIDELNITMDYSYSDNNIKLSKGNKTISFNKYDSNYCINFNKRSYIKVSTIEELGE